MWIVLNDAYLSIVEPKVLDLQKAGILRRGHTVAEGKAAQREHLCVRARTKGDLARVFGKTTREIAWPGRDYPFRAFLLRGQVAETIAARAHYIDYTNFKDSVKDDARHDAYMDIWSTMHRFGMGMFRHRGIKRTGRGHLDTRDLYE